MTFHLCCPLVKWVLLTLKTDCFFKVFSNWLWVCLWSWGNERSQIYWTQRNQDAPVFADGSIERSSISAILIFTLTILLKLFATFMVISTIFWPNTLHWDNKLPFLAHTYIKLMIYSITCRTVCKGLFKVILKTPLIFFDNVCKWDKHCTGIKCSCTLCIFILFSILLRTFYT